LDDYGDADNASERKDELAPAFLDDLVDQVLRRTRNDQPGTPVDEDQQKTDKKQSPSGPNQFTKITSDVCGFQPPFRGCLPLVHSGLS
jgi:hypothetical protein